MKYLLKIFEIPESKSDDLKKHWSFTKWIIGSLIVLIFITCLLIYIWEKYELKPLYDGIPSDGVLFWLVVLSNVLVMSNTWGFTKSLNSTLKYLYKENIDEVTIEVLEKKCNNLSRLFYITMIISVLIIGSFILRGFNIFEYSWSNIFLFNELASVTIFLLFVIIDGSFLKIIKQGLATQESSNNAQNSLEKLRETYFITEKAFYLTDIAGFLGISLILIISFIMRISIESSFIQGFSLGAIAIHIVFSQINFSLVKTMALTQNFSISV